ncbi:MFS4B-like protein [Mya arenaria]|uniref:MFS4B-like protein n=1 Tax=Mya arenaria TaxID=6604 RepID=A0ABY7DJX6_MYAAR|nr:sodium-dependent glucose transporter 1-like [Mya arenaria]WAQ96906.1 MFS4B-like protein [Mya arenaria]
METKEELGAKKDDAGKPMKSTVAKVIETGFLVAAWSVMGIYSEIYGPTQKDLVLKLNADYEQIAVAISGRTVGWFPGCVLGGLLVDRFGRWCHVTLAVSLEVAAAATVAVPYISSVNLLWAICFIGGIMESVINIAGQKLLLKLWLEKSAMPMILLHSGYGIGSFLIPLYTNPFLALVKTVDVPIDDKNSNVTVIPYIDQTQTYTDATQETLIIKESKIEYAYMISAGIVVLHSLSFYFFQIRERKFQEINVDKAIGKSTKAEEDRTLIEMVNPATCTGGRAWYGVQLFLLIFLHFANAGGGERIVANFIRSFSIDQLQFSNDDASFLNTTFWISFTVGRVLFSVAARWVSIRILIVIQTGGLTVVAVLMNLLGRHNTMAHWVLVQPLGLLVGPLWPSGVAWADYHLELTGLGMMIIMLGGSLGGICHLRLIGYLYESFGPQTFLYQVVGYAGLALVLAISLDVVGSQHGNRFLWNKVEREKEVNNSERL